MRSTSNILTEICRHPERDALRLDYAAACEAKDPEYAHYIRTEMHRGPDQLVGADYRRVAIVWRNVSRTRSKSIATAWS